MKTLAVLICVMVHLSLHAQTEDLKPLQTISTDLNNDGKPDTITITSTLSEKGKFNQVSVSLTGYDAETFVAKNAWKHVDHPFQKHNKNEVSSNYLYVAKGPKQTVVLLFGDVDEAGYRQEFSIINIKDNIANMVLDKEEGTPDIAIVAKLEDLDKDGKYELVFRGFKETYVQTDSFYEADVSNYCPYYVYTIDEDCVLNKQLTKKYNEDNYVFAGFDPAEDVRVLHPREGGRLRIVK